MPEGEATGGLVLVEPVPIQPAEQEPLNPPPVYFNVDERGVDLVSGQLNYSETQAAIGQAAQGGLAWSVSYIGQANLYQSGWRHVFAGTLNRTGDKAVISIGPRSDSFTLVGGVYVSDTGNGATLANVGYPWVYTASDGAVAEFDPGYNSYWTAFTANSGMITSLALPSGERLDFTYVQTEICPVLPRPDCEVEYEPAFRLQSVRNNLGYQVHIDYARDNANNVPQWRSWIRIAKVTTFNEGVDYCDPSASTCSYTRVWPSVTYTGATPTFATATDQISRTTSYGYSSDRLTSVTRPGDTAPSVAVAYASNRVATYSNGVESFAYDYVDSGGNRTTTVTASGLTQNFTVANLTTRQILSRTDQLGHTISFTYDGKNRMTRMAWPDGNAVEYGYDDRGNVLSTTMKPKPGPPLADIVTSATYLSTCPIRVTCNQPLTTTDARGNVTDYTYDSVHGGLLTMTSPAPTSGAPRPFMQLTYGTRYAWYKDATGIVVQAPSPVTRLLETSQCVTAAPCDGSASEVQTVLAYGAGPAFNNLLPLTISDGAGNGSLTATRTMAYTDAGDIRSVDGPLPGSDPFTDDVTLFTHDSARQQLIVRAPVVDIGGNAIYRATRNTYDARGRVINIEQGATNDEAEGFAALQSISATYDLASRPVLSSLSSGGIAYSQQAISYDALGRPECFTTRMNPATFASPPASACTPATAGAFGPDRISVNGYDDANRLTSTTTALGTAAAVSESATYSLNGELQTLVDGQGNRSTYEYDRFDRLARLRYPEPTNGSVSSTTIYEEYGYDAASNVTTMRTRAAEIFSTTYDALDRPIAISAPASVESRTFTYDSLDRILSTNTPTQSVVTTWDALGRLLTESAPLGTMSMGYDLASRRTQLNWPDGFYVTYDYDLSNSMTAIRQAGAAVGPGVIATYAYDLRGRRAQVARGNGVTTTYAYDPVSRMTGLSHDMAGAVSDQGFGYAYNPANQIVALTSSNTAYRYPAPTGATTTYANNGLNQPGNAGASALTYDVNGNLTSDGTRSFVYDAASRLVSTGSSTLTYDPADRLHQMVGTAGGQYLYDGNEITGVYPAGSPTIGNRLVRGAWADELVVAYQGATTSTPLWTLQDHLGSSLAITDAAGNAPYTLAYDEYGQPRSGNAGRMMFTGQLWLPDFGVYHYKARAYHPGLGRFLQTDPLGYATGANLYAYAGNDPTNLVDPLGLIQCRSQSGGDGGLNIVVSASCGSDGFDRFRWDTFLWGGSGTRNAFDRCGQDCRRRSVLETAAGQAQQERYRRASNENAYLAIPALAPVAVPFLAAEGTVALIAGGARLAVRAACFEAGTLVMTDRGLVAIEEIRVGNMVLSRDEITGETTYKAVTALTGGRTLPIWEVTIAVTDEAGVVRAETFGASEDHPWMTENGAWAATAKLSEGMRLIAHSGRQATVLSVTPTGESKPTYNLEVADFHTYFVGADQIWVHNECIIAANGLRITGFTRHAVMRAIGDGFGRAGVSTRAYLSALRNPVSVTSSRGALVFRGETARVVVNPNTGRVISMNPLGRGGVR